MSDKLAQDSSSGKSRMRRQINLALACFFYSSLCVPLLFILRDGSPRSIQALMITVFLLFSILSAATIGVCIACLWKRSRPLSTMAIITFVFFAKAKAYIEFHNAYTNHINSDCCNTIDCHNRQRISKIID